MLVEERKHAVVDRVHAFGEGHAGASLDDSGAENVDTTGTGFENGEAGADEAGIDADDPGGQAARRSLRP